MDLGLPVHDRARRRVGDRENEIVAEDPPRRRQRHGHMVAGDGEIPAGECSRGCLRHHHRQSWKQVDADVATGKRSMNAVARHGALVIHRVEVRRRPVCRHRSLDPAAVQIVRRPVAHVRIDELRPEAHDVLGDARIDPDVELERYARTIRSDLRLDAAVERRALGGELIDQETRFQRQEAQIGDDGVEGDRLLARAFGPEPRVLRFKPHRPCAGRIGGRRHPACGGETRFAGKDEKVADAKPLRRVVPVHPARRLVDEKGQCVRIVEPHLPCSDGEASDKALQGFVRREARIELEGDRPVGEQRRRLLVERFEIGQAQIVRFDRQCGRIADARLGFDPSIALTPRRPRASRSPRRRTGRKRD